MKTHKLIKVLAITLFTFLIASFIFYRLGKFNKYLMDEKEVAQVSESANDTTSIRGDTAYPKIDSTQKLLLSSSKSIVLTDRQTAVLDSVKKKKNNLPLKPRNPELLSSSKSAIIFEPNSKYEVYVDSVGRMRFDSLRFKRGKQ